MNLDEILGLQQFESSTMECKAKLNRNDVVGWLKSIAGFANAKGGIFFIGVEDKTNKLIGFDRTGADNERNYFNNQVNEHLTPRPKMEISFLRYEIKEKERYIIQVRVPESEIKPVILQYKGVPGIYMRREGFTNGATYEEIIIMGQKSRETQYDAFVSDVKYNSSNFTELQKFCALHNNGRTLSEKALQSLGFYNEEGYLTNGALLFADHYGGDKTAVMCSVFSGFTKGSERVVTVNRFSGNLIDDIDYMVEFVKQRMNHSFVKLDNDRADIDAYPARALFEGIVNAVAHRDYFLDGTQIQVDLYRDRLEISSPGAFYRGEMLEKTYNLSGVISKRRNSIITAILVKCGVMEAAGTGFDKIAEDYSKADKTHQPYICSFSDHFTLVLPDLTYQGGVESEEIPHLLYFPVKDGTVHDKKVLEYCYARPRNTADIAKHLGVSNSSYLRKKVLENLVENGLLSESKIARTKYYQTEHSAVTTE
jgi:ATP-dependent DNA helicase RecG